MKNFAPYQEKNLGRAQQAAEKEPTDTEGPATGMRGLETGQGGHDCTAEGGREADASG